MAVPPDVSLNDKYELTHGVAFVNGMQALTRLPLVIRMRDQSRGLNSAGYISGYRGSPVGTYDMSLWQAKSYLGKHQIHFQPGVNEDLAATAVWGTQQVNMLGGALYDGVFALWYGKAPGVDRTLDVFRHANVAGASPNGGVLVIAGDDPNAVSSTVTGYSEYNFVSVGMPLLYPASLQEYVDFGVLGIEMSRYSGCWVGFKAVTDIAESSACIDLGVDRINIQSPEFRMPEDGVHIRWPDDRLIAEKRLVEVKLRAAKAFARANPVDVRIWNPPNARIGLIAAGKAYLDLRQALSDMGVTEATAERLGLRLQKIGLVWPIEESGMREFCSGLEKIVVVEEKRGLLEDQIVAQLFRDGTRLQVLGKRDSLGDELLPSYGELSPALVFEALVKAVPELAPLPSVQERSLLLRAQRSARDDLPAVTARTAFFCSGCPHNSSTKVPNGSLALAGIGCHWLSLFMDRGTQTFTQMGGEGVTWLGMAPFSERKHVFVNLGDGTYHHSGVLAIRAAVYAKVNVTYKLLFNDAVAMTGGQMVSETYTPQEIVAQVLAEGVRRAVVVSDDIDKYRELPGTNGGFPSNVSLHHRDELDRIQHELRDVPGVTLILYDQTCAAEKRRRRKRGKLKDPDTRVFINPDVCEGCGDCSVKSNCISVEPLETPLGRKRRINQSSCNKDTTCVNGFCPSFVTVAGGTPRRSPPRAREALNSLIAALPVPFVPAVNDIYEIVIAGIGGTGVITIGAVLGMAARLSGLGVTCLDQTGIAQKNGAVLSHVRIAATQAELFSLRVAAGNADLVLGCDLMVSASAPAVSTMCPDRTRVLANTYLAPNASFVLDPVQASFGEEALRETLVKTVGADRVFLTNATGAAERLFGDSIAANMFLLGFALQRGLVPVSLAAIERAIEINGASVQNNKDALAWGRVAACDQVAVAAAAAPVEKVVAFPPSRKSETLDEIVADRRARLVEYQNKAYAEKYAMLVERARLAETRLQITGRSGFAIAVARCAYKLMAYKDEYEVARLYTNANFSASLAQTFDGPLKLGIYLAPPLFARRDPISGQLKKQRYGAWVLRVFKLLAALKFLRGSALDLFGRTEERRMERSLVREYEDLIDELCMGLTAENVTQAVRLAGMFEGIRGFGHVKEASVARIRVDIKRLAEAWRGSAQMKQAA